MTTDALSVCPYGLLDLGSPICNYKVISIWHSDARMHALHCTLTVHGETNCVHASGNIICMHVVPNFSRLVLGPCRKADNRLMQSAEVNCIYLQLVVFKPDRPGKAHAHSLRDARY